MVRSGLDKVRSLTRHCEGGINKKSEEWRRVQTDTRPIVRVANGYIQVNGLL